jgi:tetratricopeptide (TPR) repeat protein
VIRDAMKEIWKTRGAGAVLIVFLSFVAYLPTLRAGFVWDDDKHFTSNPAMLSVGGLEQIWSSLAVSRYYPLTLTSFWVQRRLWGLHPLPYHAVNIALQAANAVLLWMLLRRLQVRGAWFAAAMWAVHPVNVETVAWVTELKNAQSGMFFLLALLAFLRFEDELRPRDYVAALACGAAAMLSKPSTVVLPGIMLLCAWWRRGRWTRKDILRVTPLVAFGVGMSLLTIMEQRHRIESQTATEWTLTAGQRLILAGHAVWFYAGKLLCPLGLCFIYPHWELRAQSTLQWLPLTGLALVIGMLWHFRHARWARAATFGLGSFIIALLPVLGFFDIYFFRFSYVADHFQYLASMGLIALVVSAGVTIAERLGRRSRDFGLFMAATLLLMLSFSTWGRAQVYEDSETLWRDTLTRNPSAWIAHANLGLALQGRGRVAEAMEHYEQALRLNSDCVEAHNNLGLVLLDLGKETEAMWHFDQAARLKPNDVVVLQNLGFALSRAGKPGEAIRYYERASRLSPDLPEVRYNLAAALEQAGRTEEAIGQYEQALRLKPEYVEAQKGLARLRPGH